MVVRNVRDKLGRFIKGYSMPQEWKEKLKKYEHLNGFKKGHKIGNRFKKGNKIRNTGRTCFKKGYTPWNKGRFGKNAAHWKGGKIKIRGYIYIYQPKHPFHNNHYYIRKHRLVIEQQIGRYLLPNEQGHHLGRKDDNRPHMLMAFISRSAHLRFHNNPNNVKPEEIIFDGRKI